MVAKKETRLIVSIDDIRNWNAEIATRYVQVVKDAVVRRPTVCFRLLNEPFNVLPIFEKALDDVS